MQSYKQQRWAGVPFFVRTGKRLAQRMTKISVHFKRTPQALFARTPAEEIDPNVITPGIQPDEGIAVKFGAKRPAAQMQMAPVQAEFCYRTAFGAATPEAYTTLLLDAMRGDATLFTRGDEVEAEWRIITPIEEAWTQFRRHRSRIMRLEPAVRRKPTLSSPATIVGGVASNRRCKRPHLSHCDEVQT